MMIRVPRVGLPVAEMKAPQVPAGRACIVEMQAVYSSKGRAGIIFSCERRWAGVYQSAISKEMAGHSLNSEVQWVTSVRGGDSACSVLLTRKRFPPGATVNSSVPVTR